MSVVVVVVVVVVNVDVRGRRRLFSTDRSLMARSRRRAGEESLMLLLPRAVKVRTASRGSSGSSEFRATLSEARETMG
jgi:hypothetical protein